MFSNVTESKKNVLRRISGILFLIFLILCLGSTILLSYRSPEFELMFSFFEFQVIWEISLIWESICLSILALAFLKSIVGRKGSIKVDLFNEGNQKVGNAELYSLGLSFSFTSAFLVSLILQFYGQEMPTSSLPDEENEFLITLYKVVIIAPLLEEFLFRFLLLLLPLGFYYLIKQKGGLKQIYTGNEEIKKTEWIGILISGFLFGVAHIGWGRLFSSVKELGFFLLLLFWKISQASILGIILGYAATRYGIFSSITLHWATNSMTLINTFLLPLILGQKGGILLSLLPSLLILLFIIIGLANSIIILKDFSLRGYLKD